jgi:hypothetical protein
MRVAKRPRKFHAGDLAVIQELVRIGREVHGTLDLFQTAVPPRTMRRILAGDVTPRDLTSYKVKSLLRSIWTAGLLVKDKELALRCRIAVNAFQNRAKRDVEEARRYGVADALYSLQEFANPTEREKLIECWRGLF